MQEVRSIPQEAAEDVFFGQVVMIWARWFLIAAGVLLRGYVNRCVNDIRRRPSQPLSQRRSHPRIERRDRRLRSTQGPSDA